MLRVNLWGAFLCAKYVLPGMIERGEGGRIINMTGGGAATDRPLRGGISYASSKAGVEGMTRNLELEVSRFGITVESFTIYPRARALSAVRRGRYADGQ